jgi:hypothetical protein
MKRSAEPLVLAFDKPATVWTEALPLGNGSLGAMVFGDVEKERLQLNPEHSPTQAFGQTEQPPAESATSRNNTARHSARAIA